MKEINRKLVLSEAEGLTSRSQKPYSGYGDKIMSMEGQSDMSHQDSESTNPNRVENSQTKRSISPEEKQRIDKAWQSYNRQRTSEGDQPNVDELRVQDMLKQKGYMPPLTRDARDLLRNVEKGGTPAFISSKLKQILRENGISQKDIDSKTPQELIKMLTENRVSEQNDESPKAEAGGVGGGRKPPDDQVGHVPPSPEENSGKRVDVGKLASPDAKLLGDQINLLEGSFLNEQILQDFYKEALRIPNVNDRQEILNSIKRAGAEIRSEHLEQMSQQQAQAEQSRFGFYLTSKDLVTLRKDPIMWLDKQFDILYEFAKQGQELTSPIITNMQTVYSEAIRYLQYLPAKTEDFDNFQLQFTTRFHLIQNRVMIGHKSMEQIGEAARQLGVDGLLYAMSMEDGRVGAMFNRMHELLEDERLALNKEHHVTPELAYNLQQKIIDEQKKLAEQNVGLFVGKTEDDVRRAVRTAYDVFVCSQRMGVVVARGRRLTGLDAYFSDPAGVFNIYNIEDLLWNKFDMYTAEQHEFVNMLKRSMAEDNVTRRKDWGEVSQQQKKELLAKWNRMGENERLELGKRLFRDIYLIPDFFTSGWRIKGITDSLKERFEGAIECDLKNKKMTFESLLSDKEKSEYLKYSSEQEKKYFRDKTIKKRAEENSGNLALFMRLKASGKEDEKLIETRKIWQKIAKYRPDEIIRIFRERVGEKELEGLYQKMGEIDPELLEITGDEREKGVNVYDKFKKKYGATLGILREKALGSSGSERLPEQIDISRINSDDRLKDYREIANDALGNGGAENLAKLFKAMQNDIGIIDESGNDVAYSEEHNRKYKELESRLASCSDKIKNVEKGWEKEETISLKEKRELEQQKKEIAEDIVNFEKGNFHDRINALLVDQRFEDVYRRTLLVDDALLGELEQEKFRGRGRGEEKKPFIKLSAKFSTDREGDSLKRSWNDHANAQKAAAGLLQFIQSEDPKGKIEGAREFAAKTAAYNGLDAQVDCIRYTIGTFLNLSKKDYLWDLLAFEKGPFRHPISTLQRIAGVQVKALSRDEIRHELDNLRVMLTGPLSKEDMDTYQRLSPEDKKELREKKKKTYNDLEDVLEVSVRDKFKMSALTFLMYLLLAVGGEGVKALQESSKDLTKG